MSNEANTQLARLANQSEASVIADNNDYHNWVFDGCPSHDEETQRIIDEADDADWAQFAALENGPINHGFLSDGLDDHERAAGIIPFHVALEDGLRLGTL